MFVPTRIGHSTDTPIWCWRSSRHSTSARATTPYLATQYGPSPLLGTSPANDAVNRMWPPSPCSTIRGRNASTPWIGPQRSTSMVQRQSAWVMSSTGPPTAMPALLNTTWTLPTAANAASAISSTASSDRTSQTRRGRRRRSPAARRRPHRAPPARCRRARPVLPSTASTCAVAKPMPLAPPVTTAPLPLSVSMAADPGGPAHRQSIRVSRAGNLPTHTPMTADAPMTW